MLYRWKKRDRYGGIRRMVAASIVGAMLLPSAAATYKEIAVWGARSINNAANSDMKTDIEMLQDDYEAFRSTDGLVEYFFTDKSDNTKVDLGEAYSWLIDNGIISRDVSVAVNNVSLNTVPTVSITKSTLEDLYNTVNRSDAIMYLYKAVFGPIWARTVGVETANVRVDGGQYKTLTQMIIDHGGSTELTGEEQIEGEGNSVTNILNDSPNWRYTPQGNIYTSIWGDTNVFITQNDISQSSDASGGDANAPFSQGGAGGTSSNDFEYYADYKGIYFEPGADIWFYRTTDAIEPYLDAAMSKGLLEDEEHLRTDKFKETFYHLAEDNSLVPSWSCNAVPYVVNRTLTPVYEVVNTESATMSDVLGANYTVSQNNGGLLITRNNLYNSNTGYFTTEKLYKIDIYRYIYTFVYASEKKLSDLERDIVNYKYGMELDGLAEDEDVDIMKYLVAKGILDYEDSSQFQNLNSPISWLDFIWLLYRTANENARFDFSKVQLTDSETAWKARGYQPQTMYVIENDAFGNWGDNAEVTDDQLPSDGSQGNTLPGSTVSNDMTILDSTIQTAVSERAQEVDLDTFTQESEDGWSNVTLAADTKNTFVETVSWLALVGDYHYSMEYTGLTFVDSVADLDTVQKWLNTIADQLNSGDNRFYDDAMKRVTRQYIQTPAEFDTDNKNSYAAIRVATTMLLGNLHTACRIRSDPSIKAKISNAIAIAKGRAKTERAKKFFDLFDTQFKKMYSTENGLNIRYYRTDVNTTQYPTQGISDAKTWVLNTLKAQVYYKNSQGQGDTFVIFFNPDNIRDWDSKIGMNNSAANADAIRDDECASNHNVKILLYYSDGDKAGAKSRLSRAVTHSNLYNSGKSSYIDENGKIQVGSKPTDESAGETGSASGNSGGTGGSGSDGSGQEPLTAFVDPEGKDAFISWDSIKSYNESVTDPEMQIPITQVSDLLLYNSKTDTYAYFSDQDAKKIALVGTAVVTGDSELGVAFKSGDGESATYYYHINAIRLLMDAEQELKVLSGVRGFELPDTQFAENVSTVPLASESGYNEYGVSGVMALISQSTSPDYDVPEDNPFYAMDAVNGRRWGEFLTLSQANRVMNTISRRITYKSSDGSMNGAYAVVMFEPVDVTTMGTQPVTANMSMEDILDSAATAPKSASGRAQWNKNKALCNAFANWIYGTSGQDYIGTGYLLPKAYLYIAPDSDPNLPTGYYDPLTAEQQKAIKIVQLHEFAGEVVPLGTHLGVGEGATCSYRLSEDYRVLVNGDRVYMNAAAFTGLTSYVADSGEMSYKLSNSAMVSAPFAIGSTFKTTDRATLSTGITTPTITVIKTTKTGRIVCQVGPVIGTPGKANSNLTGIIGVSKLSDRATKNFVDYINNIEYDNLKAVKSEMFSGYSGLSITSIVKDPYLTLNGPVEGSMAIYDGSNVKVYEDGNLKSPVANVKLGAPIDYASAESYASAMTKAMNKGGNLGITSDDTEAYMQIEFPGYQYTVEDGYLTQSGAQASDYISPSLFTSLNDLIIDEMITSSNGAIPINEIPNGSIVKVGTGYYAAIGRSAENKTFVGYSVLDSDESQAVYEVKVQNAAKSFATHFIRAGNQYVNVSHFFKEFTVLDGARDDTRNNALDLVAETTMALDGRTKYEMNASGDVLPIDSTVGDESGLKYAPVEIRFDDMLLAYRVSAPDSTVPRYEIVSFAQGSISGAFESLPFWTDNLLTATMWDQTTTMLEARFRVADAIEDIMQVFKDNFGAAFRGDLFTLARLLVFIILCWLMVASWICYVFKMGGLRPVLETFRNPMSHGSGGGVDLLKVISAGTITIDDEFTLGRFLQYQLVLAVLITVVWKSGGWFG